MSEYNPGAESVDAVRQKVRDHLATEQAAAEEKDKAEGGLERYHVERLNDATGKHADCRYGLSEPCEDCGCANGCTCLAWCETCCGGRAQ